MTIHEFQTLQIGDKIYTKHYQYSKQQVEVVSKRHYGFVDVKTNDGTILTAKNQYNFYPKDWFPGKPLLKKTITWSTNIDKAKTGDWIFVCDMNDPVKEVAVAKWSESLGTFMIQYTDMQIIPTHWAAIKRPE